MLYVHTTVPQPPLDPPPWLFAPPPGWFVTLEAAATRPYVSDPWHYGAYGMDFNWTVAPRGEIGYRFDHGGALLVGYRYLASEVTHDAPAFRFFRRDRIDANWFDLTYLSRSLPAWRCLRLEWELGARGAHLFADAQQRSLGVEFQASHTFDGAGPHGGVRLAWWFGDSGLALFTRLNLGVLFGETTERVSARVTGRRARGHTSDWDHAVADFRFELGLGWTIPGQPWLRFDLGVQSEAFTWQGVTYSDVGPFLRCVLGF
jgi:hypothetical protein